MNQETKNTILVVDDELGVRQSFHMMLKDHYNFYLAETGEEANNIFLNNYVDLVLLDIRLPDMDGIELLVKLKEMAPHTKIVMVTAVREIETAIKAIKSGAYEYIVKPFEVDQVLETIDRALGRAPLSENDFKFLPVSDDYSLYEKMVGKDKRMTFIFEMSSVIAQSDGPVLIEGESGTGKEMVARAIHNRSPRKKKPFVVINCAAIPPTLMEREIFGHIRGAFTGAFSTRIGKLEIADGGTVFLDDIDSLDRAMQGKLLRVIQEKEFERLGSAQVTNVDVRFVAASNKELDKLIAKGDFREDLFYRLNVFPIKMPPLRERRSDIPLLLCYFLEKQARATGSPKKTFSQRAVDFLMKYDWPGNVRELKNLVERLVTVTPDTVIRLKDIALFDGSRSGQKDLTLKEAVDAFEKQYITEVLESVGGSRKLAARKLGIHRNTLLGRINEFGIKRS